MLTSWQQWQQASKAVSPECDKRKQLPGFQPNSEHGSHGVLVHALVQIARVRHVHEQVSTRPQSQAWQGLKAAAQCQSSWVVQRASLNSLNCLGRDLPGSGLQKCFSPSPQPIRIRRGAPRGTKLPAAPSGSDRPRKASSHYETLFPPFVMSAQTWRLQQRAVLAAAF